MDWTLRALLFCVLITIPAYHCLPLERPLELDRSGSLTGNASNAIIRVIASSSSSSSTGGGPLYQRTTFHHQHLLHTTPSPLYFHPTTYHPQLLSPFQHSEQHFHRGPFLETAQGPRQQPFNFQNRPHQPKSLENQPADIFSVFYNAFSHHHSGESFTLNSKATPSPALAPIFSVVSKSHSVSASELMAADQRKRRLKPKEQNTSRRSIAGNVPSNSWHHQTGQEFTRQKQMKHLAPDLDDTYMFQGDQAPEGGHTISAGQNRPEQNWEVPERSWAEPEKVWGEPEKVWGEPEVSWEQPEKWESQKELPEAARLTASTDLKTSDTEDESPVRFYELGEDEDDEPKELVLDKNAMQATIETAQLAARSWELPELKHLGLVPNQSFVRSAAEGMSAETVQIPFRTNAPMPKVRMTLDSSGARAKSISANSPEAVAFPEVSGGKKFGYVLDGSNVRKYRVEERTPDGYIVGEYGVLNHNNGFLRGVRYTADGTINPRLIHEALMKFLSL